MRQIPHTSPFDAIRHEEEHGKEYWSARELYKLLGYSTLQAFQNTIEKARIACENSKQDIFYHFYLQIDVIMTGNGSLRKIEAYRLSRYACFLLVQNADPKKPVIALGQSYFAYQTRHQEIANLLARTALPEDQKRFIQRSMLDTLHTRLQKAARETRVVEPSDFAPFFDNGYMSL